MKQDNCNLNDNILFKKRLNFIGVSTTKQKRSIKTKNSILIKKLVQFSNEKSSLIAFIDLETKINFIN